MGIWEFDWAPSWKGCVRTVAAIVGLIVCLLGGAASADDAPAAPPAEEALPPPLPQIAIPQAAAQRPVARRAVRRRAWRPRPVLPQGPIRSAWTSLALPANPAGLTAGQATTSCCGGFAISATRLSDERELLTLRRRQTFLNSDGEISIITAEWISPKMRLRHGPVDVTGHAWAVLQSWTNRHGILERIRNGLEEGLLGANSEIIANHDIGGRGIHDGAGRQWLDKDPLFRAKVGLKFDLPRTRILGHTVFASLSPGATLPAFGAHTSSSNDAVMPELNLAWRTRLTSRIELSGTGSVAVADRSKRMRQNDLKVHPVVAQASLLADYWFHPRWSISLGLSAHTPWVRDSGYAFDTWSKYMILGFQYRASSRDTLHLVFMENLETNINTRQQADVSDSQRENDFSLQLGWRHDF